MTTLQIIQDVVDVNTLRGDIFTVSMSIEAQTDNGRALRPRYRTLWDSVRAVAKAAVVENRLAETDWYFANHRLAALRDESDERFTDPVLDVFDMLMDACLSLLVDMNNTSKQADAQFDLSTAHDNFQAGIVTGLVRLV